MFLLGSDGDVSAQIDRVWYDSFEESVSAGVNENVGGGGFFEETEQKVDTSGKVIGSKRQRRVSQRRIQGNIDNERWELSRLGAAGLGVGLISDLLERKDHLFLNDLEFEERNNKRIHVLVDRVFPTFLSSWGDELGLRMGISGSLLSDMDEPISDNLGLVKDKTSDIAKLARNGSQILRSLRLKESRMRMQPRFWELQDSKIGSLIGSEKETQTILQEQERDEESQKNFRDLFSTNLKYEEREKLQQCRRALPVYKVKESLLRLVGEHMVVIVVGETGSGKTTQLTQYLHEHGYSKRGIIGCTQPRRVAAVTVSQRVASEMGVELGKEVGYSIRFEDVTSKSTVIKYMTDGVLMRESLSDSELDRYSVVIMDEAHERSLSTDVLFGIFRGVLANRRDFRLIVTSATMDSKKLSSFFGNAPIFRIPGRTFPVEIEYLRYFPDDYVDAAVRQCLKIHCSNPLGPEEKGDILIFMTGQEDIEATCILISERLENLVSDGAEPLLILPIYSQLPSDLQAKIFKPSPLRKVIVATNIAETSLTLDGIRYVIDSGLCKIKVYNPRIGMDSLQITPISQANASQRSGRAGRVAPGICYRMYTEQTFLGDLQPNSIPEIQRTNLSNVVLLLKSLGSKDVFCFPFIDPPSASSISTSLYQLWTLGALDDEGELTDLGLQMGRFPLDPPLSRVILTASKLECLIEAVVVVAMLSVQSVFFRPKDRIEESEAAREKFSVPESDHLTLLNVFIQWKRHKSHSKWSERHFLHQKALLRVEEVFNQILEIYSNVMGIEETPRVIWKPNPLCWDNLRKAFCSGYFHNSSKMRAIGQYVNLSTSIPAYIHPSSSLFLSGANPDYVIYHEVVITSKEYMNTVSAIDPEWLVIFAPYIFKINSRQEFTSKSSLCDKSFSKDEKKSETHIKSHNKRNIHSDDYSSPNSNSDIVLGPKPDTGSQSKKERIGQVGDASALSFSFEDL